jgi:hypothetical protein
MLRIGAQSRESELRVLRDTRIGDEHGQSMPRPSRGGVFRTAAQGERAGRTGP